MNLYKIIADEHQLSNFVDWLPDTEKHEKYYLALFARKKYDDTLKSTASDKMQLKRFTSNKGDIIKKIRQLEIPIGRYLLKNTPATQQSLALYITPNPRCTINANKKLLMSLANAITTGNLFNNPHQEAISCIQKSKSYTHVVDFDIDSKDIDLTLLSKILPSDCYEILETRGGYHILVYPKKTKEASINKWHEQIRRFYDVDQHGDQMIPVPGCYQGGFVPRFL